MTQYQAHSEENETLTQSLPNQLSFPDSERRQSERRQNSRSGKYDRRRNRCGHCKHFAMPPTEEELLGTCTAHDTPMAAAAFACPFFESNT